MKVLVSDNLSPTGVEILQKEEGIECDLKVGMSKEELIAVIPVLITSNSTCGQLSESITSRKRPKLNAGFGSPRAAEAPSTKIR